MLKNRITEQTRYGYWARISEVYVKENPMSLLCYRFKWIFLNFFPRDLKERECECDKFPDEFKFFWEVRCHGNGKKFQKDFIRLNEIEYDR